MTNNEINNAVSAIERELADLHEAYMRTGDNSLRERITVKENEIKALEAQKKYEKGMFQPVIEGMKRKGYIR